MINKDLILRYRRKLTRVLEANETKSDPYNMGVSAVARALLTDYDTLFSPSIFDCDYDDLKPLIEKYCHKKDCPICGAPMMAGPTDKEVYCTDIGYAGCKGMKIYHVENAHPLKSEWIPYPNDALRSYLHDKQMEEILAEQNERSSRFTQLDFDE